MHNSGGNERNKFWYDIMVKESLLRYKTYLGILSPTCFNLPQKHSHKTKQNGIWKLWDFGYPIWPKAWPCLCWFSLNQVHMKWQVVQNKSEVCVFAHLETGRSMLLRPNTGFSLGATKNTNVPIHTENERRRKDSSAINSGRLLSGGASPYPLVN